MTNLSTGKFQRKKRGAYHHGDLRRALLLAARRLARRGGTGEVTLRAIARDVGVTHMAVYHHFRDRNALLAAVAEHGYRRLGLAMRRRLAAAPPDGRAQMAAAGLAYVTFAMANPGDFRVMFSADVSSLAANPELHHARSEAYAALRQAIERCEAEGLLPEAATAESSALAAWALVHGLAVLVLDRAVLGPRPSRAAVERLTLQVFRSWGWRNNAGVSS